MNDALLSEIRKRNSDSDKKWEHTSNTPANLDEYRNTKKQLLEQIMELTGSPEPSPSLDALYRLGIKIACQIARTQVVETNSDSYIKTELSIVSEDIRDFCIASYDRLLSQIRQYNRMYIPDILERTVPDAEKRIAIFRLHDARKQQDAQLVQANNKSINRLFGSRG